MPLTDEILYIQIHCMQNQSTFCAKIMCEKLCTTKAPRGGRVVRRCWVNFQCRGVLQIWIKVGQGPIVLAVGAGGGCLDIFSLICHFSFLSPSLWETARYRLKYCLKGPLNPKQPTNKSSSHFFQQNNPDFVVLKDLLIHSILNCKNSSYLFHATI